VKPNVSKPSKKAPVASVESPHQVKRWAGTSSVRSWDFHAGLNYYDTCDKTLISIMLNAPYPS
jgi:hypothetical protein